MFRVTVCVCVTQNVFCLQRHVLLVLFPARGKPESSSQFYSGIRKGLLYHASVVIHVHTISMIAELQCETNEYNMQVDTGENK